MTREEFAEVMVILSASAAKEVPKEQVNVYYQLLRQVPLETLRAAAISCIARLTFHGIPTVGEILHACREVHGQVEARKERALRAERPENDPATRIVLDVAEKMAMPT